MLIMIDLTRHKERIDTEVYIAIYIYIYIHIELIVGDDLYL